MALENSRDFRVASLSVKKAKAAYDITRSSLFPTVAAAGTESASHTPGTLSTTGSSLADAYVSGQFGGLKLGARFLRPGPQSDRCGFLKSTWRPKKAVFRLKTH